MNILKNIIFVIVILFLSFTDSNALSRYIYKSSEKINITQAQKQRLIGYLEGTFFSYSENNQEKQLSPLMFAISKDGSVSSLLACNSISYYDCNPHVNIFQIIKKAEKKTNQDLKIIFFGDRLKYNNENIKVELKNFDKIFAKHFNLIKNSENYFFDRVLRPKDDDPTIYDQ